MKYPCELIRDILPLYCDGICSETSNKIIEDHLSECDECSELLNQLSESDDMTIQYSNLKEKNLEQDDLVIMKKLKSRLRKRQIITAITSVVIAFSLIIGVIVGLTKTKVPIQYKNDNVSIVAQGDELYYQLSSNRMYPVTNYKIVELGDQPGEYALYFCFYTTLWDKAFGGDNKEFSTNHPFIEEVATKVNMTVNKVYYYSGDYSSFNHESEAAMKNIMEQSVLLWSRE